MQAVDQKLLREMSGFIAERTGLSFPEERWPDLARGLERAGRELGFENPGAFSNWLNTRDLTPRQIETLASHLTVGETYFLRDPASFELLESEILPALVASRARTGRNLRLWSAGCSSGEEAYSLAIACARALPDPMSWHVSVLATDINPKALAKAEVGVYSGWSFRGAPSWLRERFFLPTPDTKLAVTPDLRRRVQFAYLNLVADTYPSLHNRTNAMDVILCRNVLMYLTPEHQRRVVEGLHACLVEGGCLLVNPAEASHALFPMFEMEHARGVIIFRKAGRARTAASRREFALARGHANEGRIEEALASCQGAMKLRPTDLATRYLFATICHELGRVDEAVTGLGKVLYLDQDFVLAHHALGGLYRRLGKKRESRRHLTIALELLSAKCKDEIVPESDGMTCGRRRPSTGKRSTSASRMFPPPYRDRVSTIQWKPAGFWRPGRGWQPERPSNRTMPTVSRSWPSLWLARAMVSPPTMSKRSAISRRSRPCPARRPFWPGS